MYMRLMSWWQLIFVSKEKLDENIKQTTKGLKGLILFYPPPPPLYLLESKVSGTRLGLAHWSGLAHWKCDIEFSAAATLPILSENLMHIKTIMIGLSKQASQLAVRMPLFFLLILQLYNITPWESRFALCRNLRSVSETRWRLKRANKNKT